MASVLNSFLIGIGYDLDKRSMDTATRSIDSLGSKAKQMAALLAGAFGVNRLLGLAKSAAKLDSFAQKTGASIPLIKALGAEYKRFGGDATDAIRDIESAYRVMSMHEAEQAGYMQQMGKIGVDGTQLLNARNYAEYFERVQKIAAKLSGDRKAQFFQAVGLSDAGEAAVRQKESIGTRIEKQEAVRPDVEKANEKLVELHRSMAALQELAASFGDKILTILVPAITRITEAVGGWLAENQGIINSGIDTVFGAIGDNLGVIVAVLTGAALFKGVQTVMMLYKALSGIATAGAAASKGLGGLGNIGGAAGGKCCDCCCNGQGSGSSFDADSKDKTDSKKKNGNKGSGKGGRKKKAGTGLAVIGAGGVGGDFDFDMLGSKGKGKGGFNLPPVPKDLQAKGSAKIAEAAGGMLTSAAGSAVIGQASKTAALKVGARIATKFIPYIGVLLEAAFTVDDALTAYQESQKNGTSMWDEFKKENWIASAASSAYDAVSGMMDSPEAIAQASVADMTSTMSPEIAANAAYMVPQSMSRPIEIAPQAITVNAKVMIDEREIGRSAVKAVTDSMSGAASTVGEGALIG